MHDATDIVNVDTSGGDIGAHENTDPASLEGLESTVSLHLRAVAVDRRHRHTRLAQLTRQAINAALGATEDHR